jgi:hypothetical protein
LNPAIVMMFGTATPSTLAMSSLDHVDLSRGAERPLVHDGDR